MRCRTLCKNNTLSTAENEKVERMQAQLHTYCAPMRSSNSKLRCGLLMRVRPVGYTSSSASSLYRGAGLPCGRERSQHSP